MEARKKTFNGIVVSDKMDKTIVVEVTNSRPMTRGTRRTSVTRFVSWSAATSARTSAGDWSRLSRRPVKEILSWYRCRLI